MFPFTKLTLAELLAKLWPRLSSAAIIKDVYDLGQATQIAIDDVTTLSNTKVESVTATGLLTSSGGTNPDISSDVTNGTLVGGANYIPGTSVFAEIVLGTNLSMTGNTLNATGGSVVTPSALTKSDDTNVTISLTGTPATSLLQAVNIAVGWSGTLADGRIASASTWNSKQNALSFGNLSDVGTDGITIGGGTGAVIGSGTTISQHVADASHNGYLSSTDWSTFNSKQDALGFTPENVANKQTDLTASATKYPTVNAVNTGLALKKTIATGNNYKFETTDSSGNLQETTVTASRAVVTDANGLPSAATTTATEIGYVNGATSSIQTQLNTITAKTTQKVFHQSGASVASTSTASEEILRSILIPAGTLGNNDMIKVLAKIDASGRSNSLVVRVRRHTSSAAAGTIYYTSNSLANTNNTVTTNIEIIMANSASAQVGSGITGTMYNGGSTPSLSTSSLNTAADMYVLITTQKTTAADPTTLVLSQVQITTP